MIYIRDGLYDNLQVRKYSAQVQVHQTSRVKDSFEHVQKILFLAKFLSEIYAKVAEETYVKGQIVFPRRVV